MVVPYEQIVYVGDNVDKDFQAPKQLGMRSVWFRNNNGLYKKEDEEGEAEEDGDAGDEADEVLDLHGDGRAPHPQPRRQRGDAPHHRAVPRGDDDAPGGA